MFSDVKINRQAYVDLSDDGLENFAKAVVEKGKNDPTYADQAPLITALEEAIPAYSIAVSNAKTFGGSDRTQAKANTRSAVLEKLDDLVEGLERAAPSKPDPTAFLTGLGFVMAKLPTRKTGKVQAPIVKSAQSGGKNAPRGKVSFVLKAADPEEVKVIVGRRSEDGGKTWVNGIVSSKLLFDLTDQPSGKDCLYSFMFLATNNRESGWSVPFPVGVY